MSLDIEAATVGGRRPYFYGHVVLALCSLARVLKSFGQANTLFLSVPGLLKDLSLTNTALGILFSVVCVVASLAQPLAGRLLDKHGGRRCITVALVLLAGSLVLLSVARNTVTAVLALLGLRAIGLGALDTFSSATVCRWYIRRRGSALALMTVLFYALTGGGTVQIIAGVQQSSGSWRTALLVAAVLCVACAPVCFAFIWDSPESMGQEPDGGIAVASPGDQLPVGSPRPFTRAEAMRTRVFWMWCIYTLVYFAGGSGTDFHLFAMAQEVGNVSVSATLSISAGVCAGVGCIVVGALLDGGTPATHMLVAGGLCLSGYLVLLTFLSTPLIAWLTGIVKGAADACSGVALPFMYAQQFGRLHQGEIFAVNRTFGVIGSGLGPLLFGVWRDIAGRYAPSLYGMAVLPVLLSIAVAFTPPREADQRLKAGQEGVHLIDTNTDASIS